MDTVTENKIKDIEEFTKLFKINIPVKEEFDYYFNLSAESKEYKNNEIYNKFNLFLELEAFVKEHGYENVFKFKMKEIDRLKDIIIQTEAYKKIMEVDLPKTKFHSKDCTNQVVEGEYLMSLDFVSANYSILKTFDSNHELGYSWKQFCEKNGLHKAFTESKSFRQVVFGNTSPKRLQSWQQERILRVVEYLKECGYEDKQFVFISHDELILKIENSGEAKKIQDICEKMEIDMTVKSTIFSLKKIKKNTFIKTVYSIESIINTDHFIKKLYSVLHGVPGQKYFMYYKKYILEQPLDSRDLLYYNDGELCSFIDEDNKKNRSGLPHYEKLKYSLTIEDAKNDYSYVWNKMTEILPNMSEEEKRRVVEIISNTCSHCYSAKTGCNCNNSD